MAQIQNFLSHLNNKNKIEIEISGLRGSAKSLLASEIVSESGYPLLCLVPSETLIPVIAEDMQLFSDMPIIRYPDQEIPPYTPLSPDSRTTTERLSALYRITTSNQAFILISSVEALLRRTIPLARIDELAELVISGEEIDQKELIDSLVYSGYEKVSLAQEPGEFSVRGGIIDVYPPFSAFEDISSANREAEIKNAPIRLDFFGDTVESIRLFDPVSQRSIREIQEAVFIPVSDVLMPAPDSSELGDILEKYNSLIAGGQQDSSEAAKIKEKLRNCRRFPGIEFYLPLFYDHLSSLFDALPPETVVLQFDKPEINQSLELIEERINRNYQEALQAGVPAFAPEDLFLCRTELAENLAQFSLVEIHDFSDPEKATNHTLLKQEITTARRREGPVAPLSNKIAEWLRAREKVALCCRSRQRASHFAELLGPYGLETLFQGNLLKPFEMKTGRVYLTERSISQGFDLPEEGLHILSEKEIFAEKRLGKSSRIPARKKEDFLRFENLQPGEYVVHAEHGVAVFQGIVHINYDNLGGDYLKLLYQGNDKLFIPVDRMALVSKYHGIADQKPTISKLGSKSWEKAKNKVKEAVWEVARELLNIYAHRQLAEGHAFSRAGEFYNELEESFPFEETSGQINAINDVIGDLTSNRTMDRLLCGDVGYGKTEVAVRAAAKVVEDGYQAALLVPTTVLAEQHLETFRQRFKGLPVRTASINRFRSDKEQREIIGELGNGRIDIIVGTHRLLSKDIVYHRLGLLIIDEEHRFGVRHKEKLKSFKKNIDVLTLTATPIPRTLQLSLLGIRDLSTINSPPRNKRPIKTFIARQDDLVIKEAIVKELQRKGQVFFVHNRVQSIQEVARRIQKLVPQARVAVGHGQMAPKQLEDIMISFTRKEIDVLVSTTIIDSGLDIPSANSIIITRTDRFGLAEIYQLRGRVGRSDEQAFAYLLVPSLDGLSREAKQRLKAVMDYNELGGGFKLAMSDLQIRGGGNILGKSQSGNIAAVGYDLYLDLLQKTVKDLKERGRTGREQSQIEIDPEINLQISAFIPEHYIQSTDQRYLAYRKITSIKEENGLVDLKSELRDRYGPIPQEVDNLISIISIKLLLISYRISKLEQGKNILAFTFLEDTPVTPEKILVQVAKDKKNNRFTPDGKLVLKTRMESPEETFNKIRQILQAID
ncbi:MAG: transcription-repair coupling factor [Thermodesulfobacteriota bacterium]